MPRAGVSDIQFQRHDTEEARLSKLRRLNQAVDELARRAELPVVTPPPVSTDIIVTGPALVGRQTGTGAAGGLTPDEALDILPRTRIRGAHWATTRTNLTLPTNDVYVQVKERCIIKSVTILTSIAAGSCVIDIRKQTYDFFPPTGGDTICFANKPTITGARKFTDAILSGWATQLQVGDILAFVLVSTSGFKTITIQLELETN